VLSQTRKEPSAGRICFFDNGTALNIREYSQAGFAGEIHKNGSFGAENLKPHVKAALC
jgi:hypothetical protein